MEALVQARRGPMEVALRVDFVGQAAADRLPADCVEPT